MKKTLLIGYLRSFLCSAGDLAASLLWRTDCSYDFDSNPSMPRERDGVVFFCSESGLVTSLDASTGTLRWHYDTGDARTNTVTSIDARQVPVTTMDGLVMLLKENE